MQFSSFDILPNDGLKPRNKYLKNEFDKIEFEWSKLKLLIPIDRKEEDKEPPQFSSKINTCQLNFNIFKRIVNIYEKKLICHLSTGRKLKNFNSINKYTYLLSLTYHSYS